MNHLSDTTYSILMAKTKYGTIYDQISKFYSFRMCIQNMLSELPFINTSDKMACYKGLITRSLAKRYCLIILRQKGWLIILSLSNDIKYIVNHKLKLKIQNYVHETKT